MIIYKSTNMVNNKVYIGLTTKTLQSRMVKHRCSAFTQNSKQAIYLAFRKYGWSNFKWEVIEEADTFEELCEREKYWISHYNSYGSDGYNETKGGEGVLGLRKPLSLETKKKIGDSNRGKIRSDEAKMNLSKAKKGKNHPLYNLRGESSHNFGLRRTEETKDRMRESKIGKYTGKDSPHAVPIIQLTMNNEFVAEYGSVKDASVSVGGRSPNIVKVCKGQRKTAYGFKWAYKVESDEI